MVQIRPIPLSIARDTRHWGVLDSAPSASPWSRWSYRIGRPQSLLQCDSQTLVTTLRTCRGIVQTWTDPLDALAWMASQCKEPPTAGPPFKGGWVGNLSYDLGRLFERLPGVAVDDLHLPLFSFGFYDEVIAMNESEAFECSLGGDEPSIQAHANPIYEGDAPLTSTFQREQYESAVARAIEYIAAGDVFQVNLAQRFTSGLELAPQAIYQRLQTGFPAFFGAFLQFSDHALICNSPELFLRVTPDPVTGRRSVVTRPIKGTRRRAWGMQHELLRSVKDQAELAMIVDLQRNDLGRVCEIGSIRVTEPRSIETHPTVYHGVSTIEGMLRQEITFVDLLRATFPGGSITGAPKIRAMQIIEELEPVRRGPYCGAIGYLSVDGPMQFNIAIRTMIAQGNKIHFSVGSGIVADSQPAAEYDETLVKAQAMMASLHAS